MNYVPKSPTLVTKIFSFKNFKQIYALTQLQIRNMRIKKRLPNQHKFCAHQSVLVVFKLIKFIVKRRKDTPNLYKYTEETYINFSNYKN